MNWFYFTALVLLVGGASAHTILQPGKSYVYEYNTTVATGLPDLTGQYAIITIRTDLHVWTDQGGNKLIFKLQNVKVGQKNGEVPNLDLRDIHISTQKNERYEKQLQLPFTASFQDGKVTDVAFEKHDVIWSKDLKRGIIDIFQFQKGQNYESQYGSEYGSHSDKHRDQHASRSRRSGKPAKYYRAKELSVLGKCEVLHVEESLPWPNNPTAQVLNVTKYVNYENCNKTPEFYYSNHAPLQCTECDADKTYPVTHNVYTELNMQVRDGHHIYEDIYKEGVVKVSPVGTEGDTFYTLYNQELTLKTISSGSPQPLQQPEQASLISNLEKWMEQIFTPTLHSAKKEVLDNIINELQRLFREFEGYQRNKADTETIKKILAVEALIQKGMRALPRDALKQLVEEQFKGGSETGTGRIALDMLARTGTKGAIEVIVKLLQENKITKHHQRISLMRNIPTHVLMPTTEIADIMLNLCSKTKEILHSPELQKTCYFSFAMVISGACTRYSQYSSRPLPDDRECPRDKIKTYVTHVKHFVEQYKQQEYEEMEAAFATVLGLMNVRDSIHALASRVLGYGTDSDLVQLTSIYALRRLAKTYPEQVHDLLFGVVYNSKERSETRIAAASIILSSRPPQEEIEKLAIYTWHVEDQQVGAFIYSSLQALSNITMPCLRDLANHAKHALDVAYIDAEDSLLMGYHGVIDNMISYLESGYAVHAFFVGEAGSFIPSKLRFQLQNYLAGYFNTLFEFEYNGIEVKDVIDKLLGPANMYSRQDFVSILKRLDKNIPNIGISYINEKLGIRPRTSEESRALVIFRFLRYKVAQYYLNATEIAEYFDKGHDVRKFLDTSGKFDLQKNLVPFDLKYVTPTAAGHHLHLDIQLPMFAAATGEYSVKVTNSQDQSELQWNVKLNVQPVFAGKMNLKFGPVLPSVESSSRDVDDNVAFSPIWGTHYAAGHHSIFIIKPQVSGKLEGRFSRKDKTFQTTIGPYEGSSGSNDKEAFFYETKPYTVHYPHQPLKPITEYAKPLRLMDKPYEINYPIDFTHAGEIYVRGSHEDEWWDQANIMDAIHERGFLGFANYWFMTQRFRMRFFKVQFGASSVMPKYNFYLNWDATPAESDPKIQPKTLRQAIWSTFSGWFSVPKVCSDVEGSSYTKPWEYQHQGHSQMNPRVIFRTTARPRAYDHSDSSESDEMHSSWSHRERVLKPYSKESSSDESREQTRDHGYSGSSGSNAPSHKLHIQTVELEKGTAVYRLNAALHVKAQQEITYGFNSTMRYDRATLTKKIETNFYKKGSDATFHAVVQGHMKFARPICYFGGKPRDDHQKKMVADYEVKWGSSSGSMSNSFKVQIQVNKSRDQERYDPLPPTDSHKPWFYIECERDMQKGFMNSEPCQKMMDHKNEFHKIHVNIDYSQARVTPKYRKAFVKINKFVSHLFYKHMSEDVDDVMRQGKAAITVDFNYTMPVVNVVVHTEREKTYYQNVFYGEHMPWISAPNARKSFHKRVAQYITHYQAPTACYASGRYMNTFDNVTLNLKTVGTCPYLVTKDCSHGNSFYVLLKNNNQKENDKTLIVGILKHNITIVPSAASSNRDVFIDGEIKQTANKVIHYLRDPVFDDTLVAYITKVGPIYNIILPYLGIRTKFDGNSLKIQASHFWRNKLCGMCGEFRGRELYNFIGPQECAHATERDLLSQYVLREGSCSAPPKSDKKLCYMDQSQSGSYSPRDQCKTQGYYAVEQGDKGCITTDAYPKCSRGCRLAEGSVKRVDAFCFDVNDERYQKAKRVIQDGGRPTVTGGDRREIRIHVPGRCVPN